MAASDLQDRNVPCLYGSACSEPDSGALTAWKLGGTQPSKIYPQRRQYCTDDSEAGLAFLPTILLFFGKRGSGTGTSILYVGGGREPHYKQMSS